MGIVLKGFDRQLNRAVAIKILSPHLASNGTSRKRFAREAQAAAAVVHPNVIPIYAVKSCETRPYIVMQLVSGHSLQSLVQENGPLDVKEIVRIAIQVADGLAAAHQQGLIHRDIKPANVLTEQDVSRVMITDFGLARAADDASVTQTGWIAGTPQFMSPEQAQGDSLDFRTDLFSLGGLMYYLATGREPFRAESPFAVIQKIIHDHPPSPTELNSDLPPLLSDIIEKLLEKNRSDRFQSANEVKELLKQYLSHLQQPLRVAKPGRVWTRRRRRTRNLVFAGLAGCCLLLATGWMIRSTGAIKTKTAGGLIENGPNTKAPPSSPPNSTTANGAERAVPLARLNSPAPGSAPQPLTTSPTLSPIKSPGFSAFFSNDTFDTELEKLSDSMDAFEKSWRQTGSHTLSGSQKAEPQDPFSIKIRELQSSLSAYDEPRPQDTKSPKRGVNTQNAIDDKTVPTVPKLKHPEKP